MFISKILTHAFFNTCLIKVLLLNLIIKIHFNYKHHYVGEQVDLDNLQIFRDYQSYHSWTSATVLNNQALIVTKKITSMVTLAELDILAKHLGMSLQVEPERNGRLWVYKNNDNTIISNKDFGDISNSINTTVCQVQKDILTLHTQLKTLLTYAQKIHQDFLDVQKAYPALSILENTCFMGKTFHELMKLSLIEHKNCKIKQKDLS